LDPWKIWYILKQILEYYHNFTNNEITLGNPIYELATKMKVRTCHSSGHMEFFGPEGQRVSQSDVIVARNAMNRIFSILSFSRDQIDDVSLQEAFDVAFESLPHTVFGNTTIQQLVI
jgi:hypothetical protein